MSTVLFLDTTSTLCEVGLIEDHGPLIHLKHHSLYTDPVSGFLPELVLKALKLGDANTHQLTHIIVVTGPGSFTGIRLGIAFAEGLGIALNIPVGSLTLFDRAYPFTRYPTLMIRDTKCKTFYAAYQANAESPLLYDVIDRHHSWFLSAAEVRDMDVGASLAPLSPPMVEQAQWGGAPLPFYLKNPFLAPQS